MKKEGKKMNKVILITGGSDGLGKAIAKQLNDEHKVIILSKNKNKLDEAAKEIGCEYFVCDVTNFQMIENCINEIIDKFGKIDVLINNAGVWLDGDLIDNSYKEISECIDVNTKGSIYMTKAVLPKMNENKEGLIINVCSQLSFESDDMSPVYTATKWAVRGFNRCAQEYLSKKNIKVVGFYPGFMKTDIFKKAGNDYDTTTGLDVEKVAKAIEFIINCDDDVVIPEFGIRSIENY